jgi:hypothetical protein
MPSTWKYHKKFARWWRQPELPGEGSSRLALLPCVAWKLPPLVEPCSHFPVTAGNSSTRGTNFAWWTVSLPIFTCQSSLLMLVSAFAGMESVRAAYTHAVGARYRFFSYGDAMLII